MTEPWGRSPWRVDVAVADRELPAHAEVVVVGAGFAGLATAWELARRGAGVVLLEADRVGAGASGHTGAIALEGTAIGPLEDADSCLESLARITRTADVDARLVLDGCWEVAHRTRPGALTPLWRDGDQLLCVADTVPGGTIDAGKVLSGLARAVERAGGAIHERCRVDAVETGGRRVVRTARGGVAADRVVVATNAYLPTLLPLPIDLRPALTLAVATAPLDDAARDAVGMRLPFYTEDLPYLWGRPMEDGALVFGSGLVFPRSADVRETRIDADDARDAFARLEARIHALHPALADVPITHRWGGPISFVPSRAPVLTAHPDDPNVVLTAGCAGHGVALSFRLGELVADHLLSGRGLPAWGALPRGAR